MKTAKIRNTIIGATILLLVSVTSAGGEVDGTFGIGYTFLDQTGNRSVAAETYDIYEELGFSLLDLRYTTPKQYELTANLKNLNLANRDLRARFARPGRVSLSGQCRKARRIYDFDGQTRTYRSRRNFDAIIIPHRSVKFLGGYTQSDRDGSLLALEGAPFTDPGAGPGSPGPLTVSEDYSVKTHYFGVQLRHEKKMLAARYRGSDFTDNLGVMDNRNNRRFRLRAFVPLPGYERLVFTGGFSTGKAKIEDRVFERTENAGWGGATWTAHPEWVFSYKLLFSRIDNKAEGLETDNAVSDLLVTKRFARKAELSMGYEFRSQDDLVDRTETNAFIFKGTVRPWARLRLRGQFAMAREDDTERTTLLGDEEITRHRCEARYDHPRGHQLTVGYRDRRRDYEDIGVEADFRTISTTLSINLPHWGRAWGSYAHSRGDYRNANEEYVFEQHVLITRAISQRYHHVQLNAGLTYLRSRLRADVEKIIFSFSADIELPKAHRLIIEYNAFNYDDFAVSDRYYTANVVQVQIQKNLNF